MSGGGGGSVVCGVVGVGVRVGGGDAAWGCRVVICHVQFAPRWILSGFSQHKKRASRTKTC